MTLRSKLSVMGVVGIIGLTAWAGYVFVVPRLHSPNSATTADPQYTLATQFVGEIYDTITEHYWEKVPDSDLITLFQLAIEKVSTQKPPTPLTDRAALLSWLESVLSTKSPADQKSFVLQVADLTLINLKPFGRSRLYGQELTQKLSDTVSNRDTSTDLYAVLGVDKDASTAQIEAQYKQKTNALRGDTSTQAKDQLAQLERAHQTLAQAETKTAYDKVGIEPTVTTKLLTPDIRYIKLAKFSPQSFTEFQNIANTADRDIKTKPTTLIFDLRDNLGGAIDILPYFLGPFIGVNQYAYDFYHQGDTTPYKTKTGWLAGLEPYKKVVVLINGQSQSSAEVMAATLKKYNVGILVGTPTKGWGTVEQIIPLKTKLDEREEYAAFLVQSVTLREDGQPIEGRGVEPTIDIRKSDWSQQLLAYFNYPELNTVIKKLVTP